MIKLGRHASLKLTDEAKEFKASVAQAAALAVAPLQRWDGPTRVDLLVVYDSRRPDLDGPIKLVLDALQGVSASRGLERVGGCLVNDRQVMDLRVRREFDKAQPRLEVAVHLLDDEVVR